MTLVFNETAFKHGVTAEDIYCAMAVPLTDIILEKHINKYLVIGFDVKGNLLEIMYNLVDEDTANVFHTWCFWAMPKNTRHAEQNIQII
ncbi:MAG: hypothetical protein LBB81_09570 [Treponema sp.]|jgi:hypothetical protein|nr:hypothetical protein [Treponema sp.]